MIIDNIIKNYFCKLQHRNQVPLKNFARGGPALSVFAVEIRLQFSRFPLLTLKLKFSENGTENTV